MRGTLALFGETFANIYQNHIAQVGGFFVAAFVFLVGQPTAAFYALWVAVILDLISRLFAESKNHGGFIRAVKERHIQSDKIFRGTAVKIVAYFFMCVLAHQSTYICQYDAPAAFFGTVVYSILFLVEVWSITENFQEAGVKSFSWISKFSKKRLEQIVDAPIQTMENSAEIAQEPE